MTLAELSAALEKRAELDWLREASAAVAADVTAIRSRFPMVGRKVGRDPLDIDFDNLTGYVNEPRLYGVQFRADL